MTVVCLGTYISISGQEKKKICQTESENGFVLRDCAIIEIHLISREFSFVTMSNSLQVEVKTVWKS